MPDVKEFLNPKSTLTPGVAGAIAMLAANSLWVTFGLPQAWTALAVSALFALLVASGLAAPLWQRGIYLVLNSLVIFSVGIGSNALGSHGALPSTTQRTSEYQGPLTLSRAYGQPPPTPPTAAGLKRREDEVAQKEQALQRREEEIRRKENEIKGGTPSPSPPPAAPGSSRKFFEQWKF
jgi:hypothetical protein